MIGKQKFCILDGATPIITVNVGLPKLDFPERPGKFLSAGVFTAAMAEDGTSVVLAPPEAQAHMNDRYVVLEGRLVFDATASTEAVGAPPFLNFVAFNLYTPPEKQSLRMTWDPSKVLGTSTWRNCTVFIATL